MRKTKVRTFREHLRENLQDPEFRHHFEEGRRALTLALKIARLREKRGLSQKALAHRMGTSQQTISRLENGEYKGFSLKTFPSRIIFSRA